jgi:hypothetical protein
MDLQRELRHKSEDIDYLVLLDVVKALRRRVRKITHAYDIPYIAGYSEDGKTVFIDRHLPRSFRWLLKTVRVEPFLLTHDELRLHYLHAHQIAARAERDAVKAVGVSWRAYQSFMKKHEKPIEEERLIRVPTTSISRPTATRRISACGKGWCAKKNRLTARATTRHRGRRQTTMRGGKRRTLRPWTT